VGKTTPASPASADGHRRPAHARAKGLWYIDGDRPTLTVSPGMVTVTGGPRGADRGSRQTGAVRGRRPVVRARPDGGPGGPARGAQPGRPVRGRPEPAARRAPA